MGEPVKLGSAFSRFMPDYQRSPEEQAELDAARAAHEAEQERRNAEWLRAAETADVPLWKERLKNAAPIVGWEAAWDPKPTDATRAVDAWFAGGCKRHLVLFGGVGCGKSTAAAYAVKAWVKTRHPVAWLMPDQLVSAVLHSYDDKAPKLHPRIVIDDMGRERKPEFTDALCDLFDMQGHTILITSNLTPVQFKDRYRDARLIDRFNHLCMAVRLTGGSMRAQNGGF